MILVLTCIRYKLHYSFCVMQYETSHSIALWLAIQGSGAICTSQSSEMFPNPLETS